MARSTFTCSLCGFTFDRDPSFDSKAEYEQNFTPEERTGETMSACEDCYQKLMAQLPRIRAERAKGGAQ